MLALPGTPSDLLISSSCRSHKKAALKKGEFQPFSAISEQRNLSLYYRQRKKAKDDRYRQDHP